MSIQISCPTFWVVNNQTGINQFDKKSTVRQQLRGVVVVTFGLIQDHVLSTHSGIGSTKINQDTLNNTSCRTIPTMLTGSIVVVVTKRFWNCREMLSSSVKPKSINIKGWPSSLWRQSHYCLEKTYVADHNVTFAIMNSMHLVK